MINVFTYLFVPCLFNFHFKSEGSFNSLEDHIYFVSDRIGVLHRVAESGKELGQEIRSFDCFYVYLMGHFRYQSEIFSTQDNNRDGF